MIIKHIEVATIDSGTGESDHFTFQTSRQITGEVIGEAIVKHFAAQLGCDYLDIPDHKLLSFKQIDDDYAFTFATEEPVFGKIFVVGFAKHVE